MNTLIKYKEKLIIALRLFMLVVVILAGSLWYNQVSSEYIENKVAKVQLIDNSFKDSRVLVRVDEYISIRDRRYDMSDKSIKDFEGALIDLRYGEYESLSDDQKIDLFENQPERILGVKVVKDYNELLDEYEDTFIIMLIFLFVGLSTLAFVYNRLYKGIIAMLRKLEKDGY